MTLKETLKGSLRTGIDWSSNGFGDKLAHRVAIQAPQPKLRPGLKEAHGQPSADRARTQPAAVDTSLRGLDQLLYSADGLSTQTR